MGACLSICSTQPVPVSEEIAPSISTGMVSTPSSTACNEIVRSAIRSTELVRDSEEIAPSTPTAMASTSSSTACNEIVRSAIRSTAPVPDSEEIAPSTPTAMASTSSSSGNAFTGKFDVFINHHGKDVKNTLASPIYHTLDLIGVRAFLDREELEAGEEFPNAINEAIRSASVHIAIFSPNYAQSRWCLHELTLMLQTNNKIIPIFYHVEPFHVRWIKGDYSKAFSEHEKKGRYKREELDEWQQALSKASDLYGYEVNERQNDQGLLIKNIVNDVIAEMRNKPLLHVATHPVGLDEAIKDFQNCVDTLSLSPQSRYNVKIVGIRGLGGSGKTTLVKEYFNQKRSSYTQSSFLFEVRDVAAKNRVHNLQKQLLEDLMHAKEEIHDSSAGKGTLECRVRSVKALIVLDDVDHINQIEALLPLKGNLQPDSLVIVTTRDSGVITSSASLAPSVSVFVYRKRALDQVHAKQLFCWHAFLRDYPEKGFEDLVEEFLEACQGLPLSLKVLGAQLFGNNDRVYWESVLSEISNILPEEIKQRLKVSYDALDKQRQQMFLDIACFFIGEQKDRAISIWDGSSSDGVLWRGWYGFQILANKCLVEMDHENCIRMHDHLRDLGREIAIKKTPSRFWSHSQFVNSQRALEERLPIRGIMAATGSSFGSNLYYEPPFEECMQLLMGHSTSRSRRLTPSALGLQLLVVRGDYFKEQFAKLSEELVWLRWYDFPHRKLPSWLSTGKLRVLELNGPQRLAELWGRKDTPPLQLRELIIIMSDPLTGLINNMAESSQLRALNMFGYRNLQMIPETIGFLKHLKKIVLRSCHFARFEISSLPEEFCLLQSLEHLELSFSHLSFLPIHFGNLRKLKYIDLRECQTLTALPVSFKQLTELQYLDLSGCGNLQLEKDILENITKLEKLRINGCSKLQQLPSEITRQMYLRELCLSNTGLRELPPDIDRLAKLEVLEIGGPCLTSLPTSLGNLSSLIKLSIKGCPKLFYLSSLRNLSSLIKLEIEGCGELTHLTGVGCLNRLEDLQLQLLGVEYLPEGFGQLVNLQTLNIWCCPIRELPLANHVDSSMFKFPRLSRIDMSGTTVSTISISEDCCPSLEYLFLHRNHDLMEIETLPTTVKVMKIFCCEKLKNLRCVAGLAKLQYLVIEECLGLKELPSFGGLVELQHLWIGKCSQVHELLSLAGLVELRHFVIKQCPELDKLPSFAYCTCLQHLEIEVSNRVTKFEGIEELRSLERLKLKTYWKRPGIKSLKNLDKLVTLEITADSRSALKRFIPPNIPKWPRKMHIIGRAVAVAVEDVQSVVDSLRFSNFTLVDELHRSSENSGIWQMELPQSNASCLIGCFLISCPPPQWSFGDDQLLWRVGYFNSFSSKVPCVSGENSVLFSWEGKGRVYIGVLPGFELMDRSEGFDSNDDLKRVFLTLNMNPAAEIKGMVVIMREWEEGRVLQVIHKFMELLEP